MGESDRCGLYSVRRVCHCLCVVECQPRRDASVTLWVASVSHECIWLWHVEHCPDRRHRVRSRSGLLRMLNGP
ncbi:hypothetical protein IEO21_08947 [Rhodonia placenta]|uniref:Uncharacterized protein n=1 Tax=Rhodonia placenta TaxID=104341 RepID=A0A8H7NV87_9APHY|nr:hypothetical protein IEO21_08947 [Postia placenta]